MNIELDGKESRMIIGALLRDITHMFCTKHEKKEIEKLRNRVLKEYKKLIDFKADNIII